MKIYIWNLPQDGENSIYTYFGVTAIAIAESKEDAIDQIVSRDRLDLSSGLMSSYYSDYYGRSAFRKRLESNEPEIREIDNFALISWGDDS